MKNSLMGVLEHVLSDLLQLCCNCKGSINKKKN